MRGTDGVLRHDKEQQEQEVKEEQQQEGRPTHGVLGDDEATHARCLHLVGLA